MMKKNMTFCPHPLTLSDVRRLPGGLPRLSFDLHSGSLYPDALSFRLFLDIQEELRRLAPSGPDDRRSLWIEVLRGGPDDWADYRQLLDDGEISGREEFEEEWAVLFPDPVIWFELSWSGCRNCLTLTFSDRLSCFWEMSRWITEEGGDPFPRTDLTAFLRPLSAYVSNAVDRICDDPSSYNDYVNARLPFRLRYGTLLRKDLWRFYPECKPFLEEEELSLLQRVAEGKAPEPEALPVMTLARYAEAWTLAASVVTGPSDPGKRIRSSVRRCGMDSEEAFLRWFARQSGRRACDLIPGELTLRPVREADGSWRLHLVFDLEDRLEEAVHAFYALWTAGWPVRIPALDPVLEVLSGEDRISVHPQPDYRSLLANPSMCLPVPYDEPSRRQWEGLVSAVDWIPVPEIRPDPFGWHSSGEIL